MLNLTHLYSSWCNLYFISERTVICMTINISYKTSCSTVQVLNKYTDFIIIQQHPPPPPIHPLIRPSPSEMKNWPYKRGGLSLQGTIYYLSESEIWPDKKSGLQLEGPYQRGTNVAPRITKANKISDYQQGAVVLVITWQLDLQLPMQSVPIITNVVSLNPAQVSCTCTQYNIM